MKNCVSCQKELPDTAMHCVFCGSKQDAPPAQAPAPAGGASNKTVMGYAAADLLKHVEQAKSAASGPPPAAAPPMGAPNPMAPPPAAAPAMGPPPGAPNPMGPPPGAGPSGAGPTMAAPMGGPPSPMGPPPGAAPPMAAPPMAAPGSAAKTMMADQLGPAPMGAGGGSPNPMMGAPNPMMGPPPGAAATPMGPPNPAMGAPNPMMGAPNPQMGAPNPMMGAPNPQMGAPNPMMGAPNPMMGAPNPMMGAPNPMMGAPNPQMGGVPMAQMGRPETEQVRPLAAPPYLASQTAARHDAPVEPWEGTLRMVMIIFGILLVAAFAAPWALGDEAVFLWSGFGDLPTKAKVMTLLIGGTGLLAVVLGALPLPTAGRGLGAAVLAVGALLYTQIVMGGIGGTPPDKLDVMDLLKLLGMMAMIPGLILRSQYKGSLAARLMVTVGALAVIATYVIPTAATGDKVALIEYFKAFGDAPDKEAISYLVMLFLSLVPFFLAVLSLSAWIPAPNGGAAIVWAWCWIIWPAALGITVFFLRVEGDLGAALKVSLGQILWAPAIAVSWMGLVGYGVATLVGKQLEHS